MARNKKKAGAEKRTIVFIDESGLSERPNLTRTWSPRGQTPVLQISFNWKQLSAIAGITIWNFYFKLYPGTIRSAQIIDFLKHLNRQLGRRKLLIVWDGLAAHKSRAVREYLDTLKGKLVIDFLPPYAPELNPVEYIWSYWKKNEMANFCPTQFSQLSTFARRKLKSVQKKRRLVTAFWKHSQLRLEL